MKKITVLVVIMLVVGLLAGCWLFPTTRCIIADPESVLLAVGEKQRLAITYSDEYGTVSVTMNCTYQSSDPEIAIVDMFNKLTLGTITGVKAGKANIRVTYWYGTYENTCDVPVEVSES